MDQTHIFGVQFVAVYVQDFDLSFDFYNKVLGLEKAYDMGGNACFFKIGKNFNLYLEGDNNRVEIDSKTMRTTFVLQVESSTAMFEKLKKAGVSIIQEEPMEMGDGEFWFQFYDPDGNILEILGGQ
jgi:predicted enzyme related to lactoylglutathione lyase